MDIDLKQNSGLKLKNRMSIKWRIFSYLAIFTAAALLLLWMFQVVFMNSFYKSIKIQALQSSADAIAKNIDKGDLEDFLTKEAVNSNSSIIISDENGDTLFSSNFTPMSRHMGIASMDITKLMDYAKSNGGSYLYWLDNGANQGGETENGMMAGPNGMFGRFRGPRKDMFGIIYVKMAAREDGSNIAVLILNENIAPLDETVQTIRTQLIYVTVIMLVLALLLALLISRKVTKPIERINASAGELAKGNYNARFDEYEYREIAELGNTLNYATTELSKNESLRRELIANISHDLRTPLTMITGYAEVMRDLPGENSQENVQIIIDEARRLTSLVNDVLDISKLQSGAQPLDPTRFDLTGSIKEILKRYAKLTDQDGYTIKFVYDGNVFVEADELRISQVVYNLVNNAITYTGKDKSVTVRQSCSDSKVLIEVIDTGEGIPEDKMPLIWDRYYKVDKEHKRAAIGTGLGLSIVKTILEQHHARYGVKSTIGQGSTFWFELTICNDDMDNPRTGRIGEK
ncbi:MAG TPA: HAMP domain-containing sensor histidine kinase [Clostridia bacterium]|nr:HAMP domain-containing sensor histidine kinase [Clostridia bacterium]